MGGYPGYDVSGIESERVDGTGSVKAGKGKNAVK
jgi:hypothetical protein